MESEEALEVRESLWRRCVHCLSGFLSERVRQATPEEIRLSKLTTSQDATIKTLERELSMLRQEVDNLKMDLEAKANIIVFYEQKFSILTGIEMQRRSYPEG